MNQHHPQQRRRKTLAAAMSLIALGAAATLQAAPIATLDRNGAWVAVEAYGPNVVRITLAPTRPRR